MTIESKLGASAVEVRVNGIIKTIDDSTAFKNAIASAITQNPGKPVDVHIVDSYIVTSSIIGTLLKYTQKEQIKMTLFVYQDDLFDLFDKLSLVDLLGVKKAR